MQGGIINVELRMDIDGYSVNVNRAGQQLRTYEGQIAKTSKALSSAERAHSSATQMLRQFVLTVASVKFAMRDLNETIFALPAAALKASGEIERMTQLMKGLSKETTEAKKAAEAASSVKFVFDLAKKSPFEVAALTDSFVKLKSGGIDPTKGGLQALTDSVAKFGGNSEALKRASVAIQQMSGKGVISMEELRQQLGEAIPDAMAMMAEGAGQSMAEFTKNVSKGTVVSASAIERMFTIMAIRNREKALEMMGTWTGMLAQLKTEWTLTLNDIGQAGLSDAAKGGIKSLSDMLKSGEFREFAVTVGAAFGIMIESITKAIKFVIEFRGEIVTLSHYMLLAFGAAKLAPHIAALTKMVRGFYAGAMAQIEVYKFAKDNESKYVVGLANKEVAQKKLLAAQEMQTLATIGIARERINAQVLLAQKEASMMRKLALKQEEFDVALTIEKEVSARKIADAQLNGMRGRKLAALKLDEISRIASIEFAAGKEMAASRRGHQTQIDGIRQVSAARLAAHSAQVTQAAILSSLSKKAIADAGMTAASIDNMGRAASRTTFLMNGLKVTMGLLLNPITLLMIAVEVGIRAWDRWGAAAKLAGERALIANNIKKNIASADSVEASKKTLAITEGKIAASNAASEKAKKSFAGGGIGDAKAVKDFETKEAATRAKLDKEAAADRKNILDGELIVAKDENSQKVARTMSINEDYIKTSQLINQNEKIRLDKEISDGSTGIAGKQIGKAALDKLRGDRRELDKQDALREIEILDRQTEYSNKLIKTVTAKMVGLKEGDAKLENLRQKKARSNDILKEVSDKRTAAARIITGLGDMDTPLPMLNTKDPNAKSGAGAKNVNQDKITWLDKVNGEIVTLQKKLEGTVVRAQNYKNFEKEAEAELQLALAEGDFDYKVKSKVGKKTVTTEERPDAIPAGAVQLLAKKKAYTVQLQEANAAMTQASNDIAGVDDFFSKNKTAAASKADSSEDANMPSTVATYRKSLEVEKDKIAEAIKVVINDKEKLDEALLKQKDLNDPDKSAPILADLYKKESNAYLDGMSEKLAGAQTFYMTQNQLRERDYALAVEDVKKKALIDKLSDKEKVLAQEKLDAVLFKMAEEQKFKMQTPLQNLTDSWQSAADRMRDASTSWSNQTIDAIMNFTKTGKFEFGKLTESILSDILRIRTEQQIGGIVNGFIDGAIKLIGGSFGGGGGDLPGFVQANMGEEMGGGFFDSIKNVFGFANGGVMSGFGEVPMNYYSQGGVANSPQVAVFGEGRMNEAYVPLPDGRSIPVTMSGGIGGGGTNVTVNVINAPAGTETKETRNADGSMSIDVIIAQVEGKISQNLSKGKGSLSSVMEKTYGLNRAMGSYG